MWPRRIRRLRARCASCIPEAHLLRRYSCTILCGAAVLPVTDT
ncbi:hypothetical protein HMPREF3192_00084 [Atopobium deltae]|uniref:Uncharacterized protein n=1 Tax=Atopobium deltae TaxID=1393034 RepID=A0A133XXL6_9ACTN|nr:hypothetical protein HMPREF3192_00084 [Atopobium deltae]